MATDESTQLNLEGLPEDVLALILTHLPSLPNLISAIVASRAMNHAFKSTKTSILRDMIPNCIPSSVLHDALVCATMREAGWHDQLEGPEVLNNVNAREFDDLLTKERSVGQLIGILQRQVDVEFLTAETSTWILTQHPIFALHGKTSLSPTEHIRYMRNLYRLDLYYTYIYRCILLSAPERRHAYSDPFNGPLIPIFRAFHLRFPLLELEQMACMTHLLTELTMHKVNDLALHDIALGRLLQRPAEQASTYYQFFGLGISFLAQLVRGNSDGYCREKLCEAGLHGNEIICPNALDGLRIGAGDNNANPYTIDEAFLERFEREHVRMPAWALGRDEVKDLNKLWFRRNYMFGGSGPVRNWAYALWDLETINQCHSYPDDPEYDAYWDDQDLGHAPNRFIECREHNKYNLSVREKERLYKKGHRGHFDYENYNPSYLNH